MTTSSTRPIYWVGFDPGSGFACAKFIPEDGVELTADIAYLPATIADGTIEKLLDRGATDATLASVLRTNEIVLSLDGNDYYFLDYLVRAGKNPRDAMGDQSRYWSKTTKHSIILLLALAATIIPERSFELRVVTALPISLYTKENRRKVKGALEGCYRYSFATKGTEYQEIEALVKCGYVAMEGQGILARFGDDISEQAVADIGERTTDLLAASGQTLDIERCEGKENIGVGQLVDALQELTLRHGRKLSTAKAHDLLYAYAHNADLPIITTADGDEIASNVVRETIEKARTRVGRALSTFMSSTWNSEGARVASDYDVVYLGGGGAYYFEDLVKEIVGERKVQLVEEPEFANIIGYADLATVLADQVPTVWERNERYG